MKKAYFLSLFVVMFALAACTGGGGSAGAAITSGATGTTPTPVATSLPTGTATTANVADFTVKLDKTSITNNGADQSKLTVIAFDTSSNIVKDAQVKVSTDNNSIYVPPDSTLTDAKGSYVGFIQSAADKSNRVIKATVTINGVSKSVGLQVTGSQLDVSVVPASAVPGGTVALIVNARDINGNGVAGVNIGITGAVSTSLSTDINGGVRTIINVPFTPGTYNINAFGLGVQAGSSLVVTSSGGGGIPDAVIPAGALPSFSISPTVLAPNTSGSSANQSNFKFVLLDSNNVPIPNVRVRFQKNGTGLGYDGVISTAGSAVLTNASGVAASAYIAGIESSPTNGVSFKACYSATDFSSATDCPNEVVANMTVAGSPVSISIGADSQLAKGVGTYSQKFAVTIVDAAGRAVVNAPVAYSVDITHFGKGIYIQTPTLSISSSAIGNAFPDLSTPPGPLRVTCPNEDTNRNASRDASEDINNNGKLEPKPSDVNIAPATPGVTTTDAKGVVLFDVTWLQSVATWEVFRIKVTTNVTGSQSVAESSFFTTFVIGDDAPGVFAAFKTPPYGSGACNSPN
jgi:hypothetical protein